MAFGDGKYGHILLRVIAETNSGGGLIFLIDGDQGTGITAAVPPDYADRMLDLMERVMDGLRHDVARMKRERGVGN